MDDVDSISLATINGSPLIANSRCTDNCVMNSQRVDNVLMVRVIDINFDAINNIMYDSQASASTYRIDCQFEISVKPFHHGSVRLPSMRKSFEYKGDNATSFVSLFDATTIRSVVNETSAESIREQLNSTAYSLYEFGEKVSNSISSPNADGTYSYPLAMPATSLSTMIRSTLDSMSGSSLQLNELRGIVVDIPKTSLLLSTQDTPEDSVSLNVTLDAFKFDLLDPELIIRTDLKVGCTEISTTGGRACDISNPLVNMMNEWKVDSYINVFTLSNVDEYIDSSPTFFENFVTTREVLTATKYSREFSHIGGRPVGSSSGEYALVRSLAAATDCYNMRSVSGFTIDFDMCSSNDLFVLDMSVDHIVVSRFMCTYQYNVLYLVLL